MFSCNETNLPLGRKNTYLALPSPIVIFKYPLTAGIKQSELSFKSCALARLLAAT